MSGWDTYKPGFFSVDSVPSVAGRSPRNEKLKARNQADAHRQTKQEQDMRVLSKKETCAVNGGGPFFPLKPFIEPMGDIDIPGFTPIIGRPRPLPLGPTIPDPIGHPIEPPICACIGEPFAWGEYPSP